MKGQLSKSVYPDRRQAPINMLKSSATGIGGWTNRMNYNVIAIRHVIIEREKWKGCRHVIILFSNK